MAKLTKKHKEALAKVDSNKLYSLKEASALLKEITYTRFRTLCRLLQCRRRKR